MHFKHFNYNVEQKGEKIVNNILLLEHFFFLVLQHWLPDFQTQIKAKIQTPASSLT